MATNKQIIGVTVGGYSFDATLSTVTFTGVSTLSLNNILLIINVNNSSNEIIYQFNRAGSGGSINNNVLTLDYNTSGMSNTDELLIYVELPFTENSPATRIQANNTKQLINSSPDARLLVQPFGTVLMSEGFIGNVIDTINLWDASLVGSGNYSVSISTLFLDKTIAVNDSVELTYRVGGLVETVGAFAQFRIGYKFGLDATQTGDVREWGYRNSAKTDGVFFRLKDGVMYFVTVKNSVETENDLTTAITAFFGSSLPNTNFHLYTIDHLGSGKISGYIDNKLLIDFTPTGSSLVGDKEKVPFVKSYNTQALTTVPSQSEIHWINLIDLSSSTIGISGKDDSGQVRQVKVNSNGELFVAPALPSDINWELTIDQQNLSGSNNLFYEPIPNGEILELKSFVVAAFSSNDGISVEVNEDVNGDGLTLNQITKRFIQTTGGTLPDVVPATKITGTALNRIQINVTQGGGGQTDVFIQLRGTSLS